MNSSISSSEIVEGGAWKRWLITLLASVFLGTGLVWFLVVVLDPFSTGRLTPFTRIAITSGSRGYTHVARVRDPRFDAAIFGNSHALRLEPARLDAVTGRHFAQLAMGKTYPAEHMFLARRFELERHGKDVFLVMVLDEAWCASTRATGEVKVPRWLYEGSNFEYARGLFSQVAFYGAFYRLGVLLGIVGDADRADGYDPDPWAPSDVPKERREMAAMARPTDAPDPGAPFPFLDDLASEIGQFDPRTSMLLMFPPVYAGFLPAPGSRAEARFSACTARVQQIVNARPRMGYLNLRSDDATTRDVNRFVDATHYDEAIARAMVPEIADVMQHMASSN